MKAFSRWFKGNSLSLTFIALFLVFLVVQGATGLWSYNSSLRTYGQPLVGWRQYLVTGHFLDGIFSNWQAAILQLGCLIIFGGILRQKGASHSIKSKREPKKKKQRRKGQQRSWLYSHSLSVAFVALFAGTFLAHVVFGTWLFNETQVMTGKDPVSLGTFARSSTFWFQTVQTWEAEFGVIAVYILLSIFLRQEGSAESKPVESSNAETGETNK